MRATIIAPLALTLLNSTLANAQSSFHPPAVTTVEHDIVLECVPTHASAEDHDRIYKISVAMAENDLGLPTDLVVVHYATSGATYNRADQYGQSELNKVPGQPIYYWTGVLNKSRLVTMKGTLSFLQKGHPTYSEEGFGSGRRSYWMMSTCHAVLPE
jgi:hypothetical protein